MDDVVDPYRLAGSVLENRFRVDQQVAAGGFGVVYAGIHLTLQKKIALKVLKIRGDLSEKARKVVYEQFQTEARMMAQLSHPNIVQAIDLGVSEMPNGEQAPWMVLEWLPGQTLREWLRARTEGPLTAVPALALMRPIFEALAMAHDEGIAHRDVKPANIMVTEGKRGRQLRLMDFGIAKLMEDGEAAGKGDTKTASEFSTYTRRYGAPEQASGSKTGPWTDVHALALILTEVLVGGGAYHSKDSRGVLGEILAPERPTPKTHGVDVGPWEPVIARAMTRNPADRYPNAGEFLAALEQMLPRSAQAVSAEPERDRTATPSPSYIDQSAMSAPSSAGPYRNTQVHGSITGSAPNTASTPNSGSFTGPSGAWPIAPAPPTPQSSGGWPVAPNYAASSLRSAARTELATEAFPLSVQTGSTNSFPLVTAQHTRSLAMPMPAPARNSFNLAGLIAGVVFLLVAGSGVGFYVFSRKSGGNSGETVATSPTAPVIAAGANANPTVSTTAPVVQNSRPEALAPSGVPAVAANAIAQPDAAVVAPSTESPQPSPTEPATANTASAGDPQSGAGHSHHHHGSSSSSSGSGQSPSTPTSSHSSSSNDNNGFDLN